MVLIGFSTSVKAQENEVIQYTHRIDGNPTRVITILGDVIVYAMEEESWNNGVCEYVEYLYVYNASKKLIDVTYDDTFHRSESTLTLLTGDRLGPNNGQQIVYDDKSIWFKCNYPSRTIFGLE